MPGAEIAQQVGSPPLLFFYTHLHDAIRAELESLSSSMLKLEGEGGEDRNLKTELSHLGSRYRFLEQVYKYHSSVEDEVSSNIQIFTFID